MFRPRLRGATRKDAVDEQDQVARGKFHVSGFKFQVSSC